MLNYLNAEFYKVFHRKYLYIMTGVLVLLAFLISLLMATMNIDDMLEQLFGILVMALSPVIYLFLFFADMTGNEEYKAQTYKNVVSFGLSREKIYLSKLIVTFVISVLSLILTLGAVILSGIAFSKGVGIGGENMMLFFVRLAASVPLYLGCIGLAAMFGMIFRSTVGFVASYIAFLGVTGNVFQLLGMKFEIFNKLLQYLIPTQFNVMTDINYGQPEILRAVAVGLGFFAVSTVIGLLLFHKKEIK